MSVFRVVLAGNRGSGKTSLLKAMSDMPIVSVEKRMIPSGRTQGLEYGRVYIRRSMVYFYVLDLTSGAEEWLTYLSKEMSALLLLIDGTTSTGEQAERLIEDVTTYWNGHIGVAISKLDSENYRAEAYDRCRKLLVGRSWVVHRDRAYARSFASDLEETLERWQRGG